jgi:hypothetical protein
MVEAEVETAAGKSGEQGAGAVAPPTAPCPAPCLLDQRFDERLELVVIDDTAWARRTRRSSGVHECTPDTVTLI